MSSIDERKLTDVKKRLGSLTAKLSANELSPSSMAELNSLCSALSVNNYKDAMTHLEVITNKDWDANMQWLPGVKTLLLLARTKLPA